MNYDSITPDTLMPSQWGDLHRRTGEAGGEAMLWLAILEDAIECYLGRSGAVGGAHPSSASSKDRRHRAAACWFSLCGDGHFGLCDPNSALIPFEIICHQFDALGCQFNPGAIRHALLTRGAWIKIQRQMRVTAGPTVGATIVRRHHNRDRENLLRRERRAQERAALKQVYARAEDAPMWDGLDSAAPASRIEEDVTR